MGKKLNRRQYEGRVCRGDYVQFERIGDFRCLYGKGAGKCQIGTVTQRGRKRLGFSAFCVFLGSVSA